MIELPILTAAPVRDACPRQRGNAATRRPPIVRSDLTHRVRRVAAHLRVRYRLQALARTAVPAGFYLVRRNPETRVASSWLIPDSSRALSCAFVIDSAVELAAPATPEMFRAI
jgi:hypothetical protein